MEISERPDSQKPRELLIKYGAQGLSDQDLIATVLGSGTHKKPLSKLSGEVLWFLNNGQFEVGVKDLLKIKGLGKAKASCIIAALELGRRFLYPSRKKISIPSEVLPLIVHYSDRKQEHLICVSLNGAYEVIAIRVVSVGLVNRTVVHPREVFAGPLSDRATAIIIAHNHPSGKVLPSMDDKDITCRLLKAGELLGMKLLDHIVFTQDDYYSFLEQGEIGLDAETSISIPLYDNLL